MIMQHKNKAREQAQFKWKIMILPSLKCFALFVIAVQLVSLETGDKHHKTIVLTVPAIA